MAFQGDEERKAYFREYNKSWYMSHRERLLGKRKEHNEEIRQFLKEYKSKLCCQVCGEDHPACLQFHHRDRKEKGFNIGGIVGRTHTSLKRLQEEIDKCDILCGNCHAKFHWQEKHLLWNGDSI